MSSPTRPSTADEIRRETERRVAEGFAHKFGGIHVECSEQWSKSVPYPLFVAAHHTTRGTILVADVSWHAVMEKFEARWAEYMLARMAEKEPSAMPNESARGMPAEVRIAPDNTGIGVAMMVGISPSTGLEVYSTAERHIIGPLVT